MRENVGNATVGSWQVHKTILTSCVNTQTNRHFKSTLISSVLFYTLIFCYMCQFSFKTMLALNLYFTLVFFFFFFFFFLFFFLLFFSQQAAYISIVAANHRASTPTITHRLRQTYTNVSLYLARSEYWDLICISMRRRNNREQWILAPGVGKPRPIP